MILKNQTLAHSFLAGGTITKGAIVMFDSDDDTVIVATAATDLLAGVALEAAASGERVEVQLAGIAEVALGGTVTRGGNITSGAAGVGVALAAAATIKASIGQAMASGVSGDLIPVQISKWAAVTA
jgi:hypothetical protein